MFRLLKIHLSIRSYGNSIHKVCLSVNTNEETELLFSLASLDRRFLISNAQLTNKPVIYCNDAFCELTGFSRSDIIQKPCTCEFLYGNETNEKAVKQIRHALQGSDEKEVDIILYRKTGRQRAGQG